MSQKTQDGDEFAEYRSTTGAEVKTANVSGDTHPVKNQLGMDDANKERIYDPKIAGERFVQFYDDSAASIREYLSNAETACIRRARYELEQAGHDVPTGVAPILETASEKVGYEPLIEVTYNEQSDATRLVIEDNGIGISVEEYQVVQRIGYSTSHSNGERLGQFGMGWMSGFQLTSVDGAFLMHTRSRLTDEAYRTIEYVANFEYLDGEPEQYGTRFEFPEFGESAKEIDITEKVEEFSEGMRVAVLYRHFDAAGNETPFSDDYLPSNMESEHDDDHTVVVFENEFFKAVSSPDCRYDRRSGDYHTYNVTMPIRRNVDEFGRAPKFEAPWKWDFRGKREDGPVVKCDSNPEIVGCSPIEDSKFEKLTEQQQSSHVRLSDVPEDAVVMPEPASSRDSYMSGHDDFWRHVSLKVADSWRDMSADLFRSFDTWSEFKDLSTAEKKVVYRAYSSFGPDYGKSDADTIQATLEEELGVTVDKNVCVKISESRKKEMVVPRGSANARLKTPARDNRKKVWQIIDEAPDGVYVAKSPSQKKAEIAWGLGETHVVRVEDTDKYDELSGIWGFETLKSLPSRNLSEKLPELDDAVVEKWENKPSQGARRSSRSTNRRSSRDPLTKVINLRCGNNSSWREDVTVLTVVEKFSDDEEVAVGPRSANKLMLYDKNDIDGTTPPMRLASKVPGVAAAAVPTYVFERLEGVDNVFTDPEQLKQTLREEEREEYDVASIVIFTDDDVREVLKYTDTDKILNEYPDTTHTFEDYDSVEVFDQTEARNIAMCDASDFDARVVSINGSRFSNDFSDILLYVDAEEIMIDERLPDVDTSSPYFQQLFAHTHAASSDNFRRAVEMVEEMGGVLPDQ
jgi:hypothetical protein